MLKDELLCFLLEMFPEAEFEILLMAVEMNSSKMEAIDYVLACQTMLEVPPPDPDQTLLAQLIDVFPDVDVGDLDEIVNKKAESQDLEDLIDYVMINFNYQEELPEEGMAPEDWSRIKKRKPKKILIEELSIGPRSYKEEMARGFRTEGRASRPFVYRRFADLSPDLVEDLETQEVRDMITDTVTERKELFAKASEAFKRGGLTGTQTAGYFAERGKELQDTIEHLKLLASYKIYLHFNQDPYGLTLDLHHLTIDEAIPLMDAFLEHHIDDGAYGEPVRVITGAGLHSQKLLGPRLRPAVWRRLNASSYTFKYDGHAIFTIYGKSRGS